MIKEAVGSYFSALDQHLFSRGIHYDLHRVMGARIITDTGVLFTVWAPNATHVEVIGDFNDWQPGQHSMHLHESCGVWERLIPGIFAGCRYKFLIHTRSGEWLYKADPFALASEQRPRTASVVAQMDRHQWDDDTWMEARTERSIEEPINIYEVHLGSWREVHGYVDLAHQLVEYCHQMHYTHVELMPVTEHPLDESWGYQVTGYFAPTSRYGWFHDFQAMVDILHQGGIGVIVDWVPGHFPDDAHGLARFDGTYLYEYVHPCQRKHPHWHTHIFDLGRPQVANFLIASALFWLEVMHVDGLRVDAVASMLYHDFGREGGGWIPNRKGGRENLEAIAFLKHLNVVVHQRCPGILMIAEESSSFPRVTQPVDCGGLGFDLKWNMGWMNDTLEYFSTDPLYRKYHHDKLTFGILYACSERFVLVLSHDEVVHGKRSLLNKMPGDRWQQFANVRLLLSYMVCQPGKKLLFQSGEIGQWDEWDCKQIVQWHLLRDPLNKGLQETVAALNVLYLDNPALWERDNHPEGFDWVSHTDHKQSVISYLRRGKSHTLLCVHNFTPQTHQHYHLPISATKLTLLCNTDNQQFGGSGYGGDVEMGKGELFVDIPPLATLIYRVTWNR